MAEYIDKQTALEIIASFRTPYRKEVRVEDVYDAVSKAETVTINDHPEEIKVTNCNHNADDSKMVSSSWPHENGKDAVYRQDAIDALNLCYASIELDHDRPVNRYEGMFYTAIKMAFERLPSAQPEKRTQKRTETHACDLISRQKVRYKLTALVNELEEIFADIRERNDDDSVCGLCEYDGAYIGQSGDWCNECPGFDKSDCFKLKDKYREEWVAIDE